ncbi:MAG: hypothetical protein ACI3XM_07185 [Eubacteriales bacterium]
MHTDRIHAPHPRRKSIRVISYLLAAAVLTAASLYAVYKADKRAEHAEHAMRERVLYRMAEEAAAASELLDTAASDEDSASAVSEHCAVIIACTDLLAGYDDTGAADAAVFYRALRRNLPLCENTSVYKSCAAQCAELLAALALTEVSHADKEIPLFGVSDATNPAANTKNASASAVPSALAQLSAAFAPDLSDLSDGQPDDEKHTYDGESIVSDAEARQKLKALPNCASKFLSHVSTDSGCYRFFCTNGYAEVSVHGGHLLRYALYPRASGSDAACVTRSLSDGDLSSCAVGFICAAGVCVNDDMFQTYEDRHGIRYFRTDAPHGGWISVGVRMCDGQIVWFDGEAQYKNVKND